MDIEEVIRNGEAWVESVNWAEQHGLRLTEYHIADPDRIRSAFQILYEQNTPLSSFFPDGERAVPPFTPRQVHLLAGQSYRRPISHKELEYQQAHLKVRHELGRREKRDCSGVTKDGAPCKAFALSYSEADRCWSHATQEARDENKRLLHLERETLYAELQRINDTT